MGLLILAAYCFSRLYRYRSKNTSTRLKVDEMNNEVSAACRSRALAAAGALAVTRVLRARAVRRLRRCRSSEEGWAERTKK